MGKTKNSRGFSSTTSSIKIKWKSKHHGNNLDESWECYDGGNHHHGAHIATQWAKRKSQGSTAVTADKNLFAISDTLTPPIFFSQQCKFDTYVPHSPKSITPWSSFPLLAHFKKEPLKPPTLNPPLFDKCYFRKRTPPQVFPLFFSRFSLYKIRENNW